MKKIVLVLNRFTLAKKLHNWYLEATKTLNPKSYNKDAQKSYEDLTDEQKFIDMFIALKVIGLIEQQKQKTAKAIFEDIEKMKFEKEDLNYLHEGGYDDKAMFNLVFIKIKKLKQKYGVSK